MKLKVLYLICVVCIIIGSYYFEKTKGLVTNVSTDTYLDYVTDYMSSGSDDNIVISISCFLFLIVLLVGFIPKKNFGLEYCFAMSCFFIQFVFFFLIELGSIVVTIYLTRNFPLVLYFIGLIAAFCLLQIRLFLVNKRECEIKSVN